MCTPLHPLPGGEAVIDVSSATETELKEMRAHVEVVRRATSILPRPGDAQSPAPAQLAQRVCGSLLFAHFGVTGPAALDLSRHWHRSEGHARRVTLSFVPEMTREALEHAWVQYASVHARRGVRTWLAEFLPERIADVLTSESGVGGAAMSQVPRERRSAVLRSLTERDLGVTATLGYEKAEVTAGGVPLAEMDPSTLESRIAPGLYLCGEVLDVEGRLGGFNFQWAWSSGTVAGRAAGR